jgi:uncharacterized protein with HEPN domain
MARHSEIALEDIIAAISGIEDAVIGYSRHEFASNWLLQRGMERALEIISEAVRHLPDALLATRPEIHWQDIRAIGNLIRHEYHRVDPEVIWAVITDDLPPLRLAIEAMQAMKPLQPPG